MISWIYLILAGLFEVGFTTSLSMADQAVGKEKMLWYISFAISLILSMFLLIVASKQIPMGTSYAVFAGIGAVGTALVGIFFFGEQANFWRLFFLFTLISSLIGLNLVSGHK